jgi:hypothetical protein
MNPTLASMKGESCLAVFENQLLAPLHGLRERAVMKKQVLPVPALLADQFIEVGAVSAGMHHDVSPQSEAPVLVNGCLSEKVESFC